MTQPHLQLQASHTHSLMYVCVVSDFTLPTLEACLSLRPANIVLIASDSYIAPAQRLETVLKGKLLAHDCQVQVLSRDVIGQALDGDDICANQAWLAAHLQPLLHQHTTQGGWCVANITGGTKAMTLALTICFAWHRLDYQTHGNKPMQCVQMQQMQQMQQMPKLTASATPSMDLDNATPLDIALLHNSNARVLPTNPLRSEQSASLAQRIWHAQREQEPGLLQLWAGFERVWVFEQALHQAPCITLPWADFLPASAPQADIEAITDWVTQLQQLAPSVELHADAHGITLPGNKAKNQAKKQHKALREWICGDWLEQLALHWLLDRAIPPQAIACNLTCADKDNSGSQREVDLLVHHQHLTSLIEIKAGLPPGKTAGDLENQLSSIGARLGKTRKGLLLGPYLLQVLRQQNKAQDFWWRCQANQVTLLLEPEHLAGFVQNRKPWGNLGRDQVPPCFQ